MSNTDQQLRRVKCDFEQRLQPWDGFGFNYVETCQTRDYPSCPQDYGGFSLLSPADRTKVIDLIFGPDGLQPGILKMFLDCWHLASASRSPNESQYDHKRTTKWMRYFAAEGSRILGEQGQRLKVLTTLYGPPAWMTRQGIVRGRDLDPGYRPALANYIASWARFLREQEGLEVYACSIHNEGEDWSRWTPEGMSDISDGHDYNLFWSPEAVAEFLPILRGELDRAGLQHVAVSPGETTNWKRFQTWGYAQALRSDARALAALGLITSHGFHAPGMQRWSADHRSSGADLLREVRPNLRAWTTSTGWGLKFGMLVWEAEQNIYSAKLNGFIPWAGIQRSRQWAGGDPNPNCAITVHENGSYTVNPEYYVYKHLCRAGRSEKHVAAVAANDSEISAIAFSAAGSHGENALVLANTGEEAKATRIEVRGAQGRFQLFRTTPYDFWQDGGIVALPATMTLPAQSVLSFHEVNSEPRS